MQMEFAPTKPILHITILQLQIILREKIALQGQVILHGEKTTQVLVAPLGKMITYPTLKLRKPVYQIIRLSPIHNKRME